MSEEVKLKTSGVLVADGADINLEYLDKGDGLMLHIGNFNGEFENETLLSKSELFDLIAKLIETYGCLK